jgi:hypothetical protein
MRKQCSPSCFNPARKDVDRLLISWPPGSSPGEAWSRASVRQLSLSECCALVRVPLHPRRFRDLSVIHVLQGLKLETSSDDRVHFCRPLRAALDQLTKEGSSGTPILCNRDHLMPRQVLYAIASSAIYRHKLTAHICRQCRKSMFGEAKRSSCTGR